MNVYCITCPQCKWQMHMNAPNIYPIKNSYRAPKCAWCGFQTREWDRKVSNEPKFQAHFSNVILHALTTIGEFYDHC